MPKQAERKFGVIPEAMKSGPVTVKNYPYRAEAHCATQSAARKGLHPTIKKGEPEFAVWLDYFDRHLGGRPLGMRMMLDGGMAEMTVPELNPEWFDPSFERSH